MTIKLCLLGKIFSMVSRELGKLLLQHWEFCSQFLYSAVLTAPASDKPSTCSMFVWIKIGPVKDYDTHILLIYNCRVRQRPRELPEIWEFIVVTQGSKCTRTAIEDNLVKHKQRGWLLYPRGSGTHPASPWQPRHPHAAAQDTSLPPGFSRLEESRAWNEPPAMLVVALISPGT